MWSDTYNRELWEEGRGPTITTWLLTPLSAFVLLVELLLGFAIADGYLTTGAGWIGGMLAAVVGLIGPVAAVMGWRAGAKRGEQGMRKFGRAVRRGLAFGVLPMLFLVLWLGAISII